MIRPTVGHVCVVGATLVYRYMYAKLLACLAGIDSLIVRPSNRRKGDTITEIALLVEILLAYKAPVAELAPECARPPDRSGQEMPLWPK